MDSPTPDRSLDRSLIHGIAWTGGVRWLTQLLSWAATLIVARLLTPTDYGLVGMAMVFVGFAQIITEGGLTAAIVQQRGLSEDQVARLGGLAVMLGVGLWAACLALAAPIAWFFGEASVREILLVLSVGFLLRSLQVLPRSLLARDLQFRRLAWIDGIETLTLLASTLALALVGLGYWALVLGSLASGVATSALCLVWRPHRITFPRDLVAITEAVRFGWHIVVTQIAWYAYTNADFAVVGRVLGKAALGAYTFAWTIASIPVDRVSGLVGRVTPAFFAAVQTDPPALGRYLRNLTEGLALVTVPACIGLALVADDFVRVMLGDAWREAITPLRLLALYAALRSIMTLAPQVLIAMGHARRSMHFSILAALILPGVFYVGTTWGTAGVALGWVIGYPIIAVLTFVRTALQLVGMSWTEYLRALWPAASATGVMAAAVLSARPVVPAAWSPLARLAIATTVGIVAYGAVVFTVHGSRVRAIRSLLRAPRAAAETRSLACAAS